MQADWRKLVVLLVLAPPSLFVKLGVTRIIIAMHSRTTIQYNTNSLNTLKHLLLSASSTYSTQAYALSTVSPPAQNAVFCNKTYRLQVLFIKHFNLRNSHFKATKKINLGMLLHPDMLP